MLVVAATPWIGENGDSGEKIQTKRSRRIVRSIDFA